MTDLLDQSYVTCGRLHLLVLDTKYGEDNEEMLAQ